MRTMPGTLRKEESNMFFISVIMSQAIASTTLGPVAFPVFLKEGFSSILEFEEAPTKVVLGDQNLFQIENLDRSIVIKPLMAYAVTNMFVYFKSKETRLFVLSASDDAEPTYFKKFTSIAPVVQRSKPPTAPKTLQFGARVKSAQFDAKKDYFTLDFEISADSSAKVSPNWDSIRLKYKDRTLGPSKIWSERREVQRDSSTRARLIFTKPNLPADLANVSVEIPLKGSTRSLVLDLGKAKK
jgi:hypothetical protein